MITQTTYNLTPIPKPRQTRADKWQKRPCVMRWRHYADECKRLKVDLPESGSRVTFTMPMPVSWTKKRRKSMLAKPHRQVPDVDNLLKGLLDAIFKDDSKIWDIRATKVWGEQGSITITYGG